MSRFRLGVRMFARDMRQSVSLAVTFGIAIAAFLLAFAVSTGFHL